MLKECETSQCEAFIPEDAAADGLRRLARKWPADFPGVPIVSSGPVSAIPLLKHLLTPQLIEIVLLPFQLLLQHLLTTF